MSMVLVVEDNPANRKLLTVILRKAGHEVVTADDAPGALRAIQEHVPDLVLMDLGLPGIDGYALTRQLRRDPATAAVPILAVTSFAMQGDAEKARQAGCVGHIPKPIQRELLLRKVGKALARGAKDSMMAVSGTAPMDADLWEASGR